MQSGLTFLTCLETMKNYCPLGLPLEFHSSYNTKESVTIYCPYLIKAIFITNYFFVILILILHISPSSSCIDWINFHLGSWTLFILSSWPLYLLCGACTAKLHRRGSAPLWRRVYNVDLRFFFISFLLWPVSLCFTQFFLLNCWTIFHSWL